MSFRLPRELVAEFRAAARAELGEMLYGPNERAVAGWRDRASRVVVERLIRAYVASQQQPK